MVAWGSFSHRASQLASWSACLATSVAVKRRVTRMYRSQSRKLFAISLSIIGIPSLFKPFQKMFPGGQVFLSNPENLQFS